MSNDVGYRYPASPQNVPVEVTRPSAQFKNEVYGVLGSILLFIATYIVLVIAGLAIAAACVLIGYFVITAVTNLWSLLLAIGLVVMAIFVVVFLFKFIFKSTRVDQSGMREIKAQDHPLLFDFIKRVASETQTPLPRKVFLSSDVNAFVFYNSTFWSMFFPVRKNLNIGLGLINCVTISEFKAILAHEFGHFSQRSMKLHSYVYHVNHIIHNMLYDNQGYGETLQRFANLTGIFSLVGELTYSVIRAIQYVLEKVYGIVTRRSMALSRQMEFHADAVAASVSGSAPLARALYRLDYAQSCYHRVLETYNNWIGLNRKGVNVFSHHTMVMNDLAKDLRLNVQNGLVNLTVDDVRKHHRTRVVVKDQWASHPSNEDREVQLKKLALEADEINDSAWTLFSNAEKLQKAVTEQIYAPVQFPQTPELVDTDQFRSIIDENIRKYSFHEAYKGLYDKRDLSKFDLEEAIRLSDPIPATLNEIITPDILTLDIVISGLDADLQLLNAIKGKDSGIKTFDFDGKKYSRDDSWGLIRQLEAEREAAIKKLEHTDKTIFRLYHRQAVSAGVGADALAFYKTTLSKCLELNERIQSLTSRLGEFAQLFSPGLTYDGARAVINNMLRVRKEMRDELATLLSDNAYSDYLTSDERKSLDGFSKDERDFLGAQSLNEEPVQLYGEALQLFQKALGEHSFKLKKSLLDEQVRMIGVDAAVVA